MNYNEALNYIHSLGKFSHKAGLSRIRDVCCRLYNPQNDFKCIHVAGTNGKGSVCAFISSALIEAGYKVGTFVSPYITDFCERIQINGVHISRDDLCRLSQRVIDTGVSLTEFEFITAIGFLYFSENKIDVAVLETGLGGRYDATNIINCPLVSVITKIGLDHTAVLGDTLTDIAKEKCGIIKGDNVVTTYTQPNEALSVIKSYAPNLKIPNKNELDNIDCSVFGNSFTYKQTPYQTKLCGNHQIENALLAIEALKNCGLNISDANIFVGLKNAFIPARLELVGKGPLIFIDGAHNPDGAEALYDTVKQYEGATAIIGVMRDKNYEQVLARLLPLCKNAICVGLNMPRALSAKDLAVVAQNYCKSCYAFNDIPSAINKAKQLCGGNPIFIFGSLYLASEVRSILAAKK